MTADTAGSGNSGTAADSGISTNSTYSNDTTTTASSSSTEPDPCQMVKLMSTHPDDWNLFSLDQLVPGDGCVRGARRLTDAGGSFD